MAKDTEKTEVKTVESSAAEVLIKAIKKADRETQKDLALAYANDKELKNIFLGIAFKSK